MGNGLLNSHGIRLGHDFAKWEPMSYRFELMGVSSIEVMTDLRATVSVEELLSL